MFCSVLCSGVKNVFLFCSVLCSSAILCVRIVLVIIRVRQIRTLKILKPWTTFEDRIFKPAVYFTPRTVYLWWYQGISRLISSKIFQRTVHSFLPEYYADMKHFEYAESDMRTRTWISYIIFMKCSGSVLVLAWKKSHVLFCSVFWAQNYFHVLFCSVFCRTEQNTTVLEHVFCVLSSLVHNVRITHQNIVCVL